MTRALLITALILTPMTARAQQFSVSDRPTVSIGQVDGDPNYLLSRVSVARKLSDGRIMITMGPDIRFYDASGRHLSNAGGRGRGPGEFQYIQDLVVLPGDTLLILHFRDKVWLDPQGTYIRQEAMDLSPLAADGWVSEGATLLGNGNLLATQYRRSEGSAPSRELHRPTLRYVVFDPVRGLVTPLITAGGLRQIVEPGGGGGVQLFSPHAQHAVGRDVIYVGDNDTTFIGAYTVDGRHLRDIQVATQPTQVTSADLESARRAALDRIGDDDERRARYERSWAAVPKPARYPYWNTAIVDRTGLLWVSYYNSRDTPPRWTVFDSTGRRITEVELPARMRISEIGADYILGIEYDEFDVEYVRLYPLTRRPR